MSSKLTFQLIGGAPDALINKQGTQPLAFNVNESHGWIHL
jgi:hypothetical protein